MANQNKSYLIAKVKQLIMMRANLDANTIEILTNSFLGKLINQIKGDYIEDLDLNIATLIPNNMSNETLQKHVIKHVDEYLSTL